MARLVNVSGRPVFVTIRPGVVIEVLPGRAVEADEDLNRVLIARGFLRIVEDVQEEKTKEEEVKLDSVAAILEAVKAKKLGRRKALDLLSGMELSQEDVEILKASGIKSFVKFAEKIEAEISSQASVEEPVVEGETQAEEGSGSSGGE